MSSFGPSVVEVPSPVLDALTCPGVPPVLVPSAVVPVPAVVPSVWPCVLPLVVGASPVVGVAAVVAESVPVPAVVPVAVTGLVLLDCPSLPVPSPESEHPDIHTEAASSARPTP